uniref:Sperm associated antigen 1 n=1 Tax=Amphilophus citrinellus TaxID=61819 RepID=A0A3Q0R1J3_AMPCI
MSADAAFSLQSQPTPVDYSGKVPVEHLDYDYIEKCKDVKYLKKILRVLRSGEEGIYPHLIKFCESHLEKLDPRSQALRKDMPVATAASLSEDEWNQIADELKRWQEETKKTETSLKHQSVFDDLVKENVPPVRGSNCFVPLIPKERKKPSKCALPRDYQEWDKFDVEKECEKIDGDVDKNDPPAIVNSGHPIIKTKVDASLLSQQEKLVLANREKDKGNEAFRANDYEEAVAYYSRSLSIIPTVAAYNNRAQAEINLKHWHNAMRDCQRVLELEPGNMKALLRRATVYNHMGNFHMATEDLRMVLKEEPQNSAATVGDRTEASTPAESGDMGNTHKKPYGRGDGGPHAESNNSHYDHRRNRGGSSDKYKVSQDSKEKITNGSSKRGSTASVQGDQSSSGKATPVGGNARETVNLDAPCGALPPPLARLKNEGNLLFKKGQFADALEKYSQAIQGYTDSEDLCILYSNRAACYLKDGNSQDCIQDCTKALELQPFSLKPLLRRAMAYESLERYRKAYVDYKTVLQIDISVQAAHDSVNRITRLLIEQDGPEWREKLPEIPMVPLSAQQHRREEPPSRRAEVCFSALKQEGNDFVKKGQYQDALGKYTECLKLKPEECAIYTNRALCYLKLERFAEAKQDCDAALKLEPTNKKAFYRRAMANKGLKVNRLSSSVFPLQIYHTYKCTTLLIQVEDDENVTVIPNSENSCRGEDITINLHPTSAYEFGQSLNAARCTGNTVACAQLLASMAPEMLPQFLSTQLDGHTISFIMQALDLHLLEKDPNLVYQHLSHLHTAERFSVALMLLEDERHHMTQLFEHLSAVQSTQFTKNDVQNLANKYI